MALLWMDGFDHYGTAATGRANMQAGAWAVVALDGGPTAGGPGPRTGAYTLDLTTSATSNLFRRLFGSPKTRIGFGAAFYMNLIPGSDTTGVALRLLDSSGAQQLTVNIGASGQVRACRGSEAGTLIGASAQDVVNALQYFHIECAVTAGQGTAGAVEVRINGATVLNLTGVDTCNTAATEYSSLQIRGPNLYVDDLFCWDDTGGVNDDFLGDRRVYLLMPNADTADAEWTPSTGATQFGVIDEVPPNGETDFLQSIVAGDLTVVTLEDLPTAAVSVSAVQTFSMVLKTDAGPGNLTMGVRSGATDADGVDRPVTTAFNYYSDVFDIDPNTGAPWTPGTVNAAGLRLLRSL